MYINNETEMESAASESDLAKPEKSHITMIQISKYDITKHLCIKSVKSIAASQ